MLHCSKSTYMLKLFLIAVLQENKQLKSFSKKTKTNEDCGFDAALL